MPRKPKLKRYSVLIVFPQHLCEDGIQTHFVWTTASDPAEAACKAQVRVAKENLAYYAGEETAESAAGYFTPVLVLAGWQRGL